MFTKIVFITIVEAVVFIVVKNSLEIVFKKIFIK
jgi:hypothetical protein